MPKMRMFLRKSTIGREPLAVSMSSVKAGERVLQIGVDDPRIAHAIASKAGLTGLAVILVPDEPGANRVRGYTGEGAAAAEVRIEPLDRLPFENDAYDIVVIHNLEGQLAAMDKTARERALRECLRVLRPGGRALVLDAGTPTGIRAMFGGGPKHDGAYEAGGGTPGALQSAGFTAVRPLGDREGYRFIEGIKPRQGSN
jgi:SAM-dependent methyltransferase